MDKDEQELIREALDYLKKIQKNIKLGRFGIDSTDEAHLWITTDCGGGLVFASNGNSIFTTYNSSIECVGLKLKPSGSSPPPPAKIIHAWNGDIVLDAKQGDIVLRGKNIKIVATDSTGGQIVMDSSKLFNVSAPVTKISGDYCTISGSADISTMAGTGSNHGEIIQESSSGTSATKSSLLGRILAIIEKVKKFFESPCAGI